MLSSLCDKHLLRTNDDDFGWVDYVGIDNHVDMVLVNFKSTKEQCEYDDDFNVISTEVVEINKMVWFDRNGKILMVEGRFSHSFYGCDEHDLDRIIISIMNNEIPIQLNIKDCLKMKNVFQGQ